MRTILLRALSVIGCALALGACGQRGPLYLPQPTPAAQSTVPAHTDDPAKDKAPPSSAIAPP